MLINVNCHFESVKSTCIQRKAYCHQWSQRKGGNKKNVSVKVFDYHNTQKIEKEREREKHRESEKKFAEQNRATRFRFDNSRANLKHEQLNINFNKNQIFEQTKQIR